MNAESRRWVSLASLLLGATLALPAVSAETKTELSDDIDRRFEASTNKIDETPIEFGCNFSRYIVSKRQRSYFPNLNPPLYRGVVRLEEPASLPQPTLVETYIAKGFLSGELRRIAPADDSYYLAPERHDDRDVYSWTLAFQR